MEDTIVRLESICIKNFKNVANGQLSFANPRKNYKASILGLYGQNGSGKTALIDAVELLQLALKGQPIPEKFADYIQVGAEYASLYYVFSVIGESGRYQAFYELKLRAEKSETPQNLVANDNEEVHYRAAITDEILSYSYEGCGEKARKSPLIDTTSQKVFAPAGKYACLIGKDRDAAMDLLVAKNMLLMESLVRYGNYELFVIHTANSGIISMNMLPLSFRYEDATMGAVGNLLLPLEDAAPIPQEALDMAEHVIANMNVVLEQIVPGLTIRIETLGEMLFANGKKGVKVQLVSLKNQKAIPLKYESEGIKKIISILQLLIVVYNRSSITVAIDELDAGVFEYLLGELLRILSEKGKGQLLFTSHNLRPLETLDRGFIAFTTTNPQHRYIRMTNLKENNNLRDFYYRDIVLGEQSEVLYDSTDNAEIAFAFREAGEPHDA